MRRISGQHGYVVIDKHPQEKPGFSRFRRPAERCLNGECTDANGYYIEQNDIQQNDTQQNDPATCAGLPLPG